MEILRIQLDGQDGWVQPEAGLITGYVEWALDEAPDRVEIRLLWYTEGRGSRDVGILQRDVIEAPGNMGRQEFRWKAPDAPYSFEGRLITLQWVVEAAVDPGELVQQAPLVISPFRVPVRLVSVDQQASG